MQDLYVTDNRFRLTKWDYLNPGTYRFEYHPTVNNAIAIIRNSDNTILVYVTPEDLNIIRNIN